MTFDETPLPRVRDEDFQEQFGVIRVAAVAARASLVWRPTSQRDVGIDGQIEHIDNEGRATGRMVSVQIKSGPSYFRTEANGFIRFAPEPKHANYWERAALPVILVLHREDQGRTVWVDARDSLRQNMGAVLIPSSNVLDHRSLRVAMGPTPDHPLSMSSIATDMLKNSSLGSGVSIDFLDLFVHELVSAFTEIYFGMDLVDSVVEAKLRQSEGTTYGFGSKEYDFIHDYVRYLLQQDLARFSYDDFNLVWEHQQLVGRLLAPLTARGAALARYLAHSEPSPSGPIRAIQDKAFAGIHDFEAVRRADQVSRLKDAIRSQDG